MSLRSKVLSLVDVILRVPPLFIIDELFRISLGLPHSENYVAKESYLNVTQVLTQNESLSATIQHYDSQFYKILLINIVKFLLSCSGEYDTFLKLNMYINRLYV